MRLGYFDLKQLVDGKPTFVGENGTGELAFPAEGTLADDEQACFYVWGFQDASKKGEAFKVQIAYKTTASGSEERTRTFSVYAPKSKVTPSEKMFDDGYAYNVVLTVNATNKLGGTAADWNNGGMLFTRTVTFGGKSVSLGFTTPLDFVAEAPAINKAGDGFVLNHNLPANDVVANLQGNEVGYYNWADAKALFDANKPFLANYYLPTKEQWQSIFPFSIPLNYVSFQGEQTTRVLQEIAQIGENPEEEYSSEFITVDEDGKFVTYALRFKNTKWVSAWRYSYEGEGSNKKLLIKCVPLEGKSDVNLHSIKTSIFFISNDSSVRTFPAYGYHNKSKENLTALFTGGFFWSRSAKDSNNGYRLNFYSSYAAIGYDQKVLGFTIRPFKKN